MPLFRNDSVAYCRWLTRSAGSHFMMGLRLLPRKRREAMEVVYAFCRAVDDVADQSEAAFGVPSSKSEAGFGRRPVPASESAARELLLWRHELNACLHGFPTHPIAVALQPVIADYQIPLQPFEALIAGMEMDLHPQRYETFAQLRVYCERVASAVGLISIRVFGCTHPAAEAYAVNLGIALQLTNILRDVKTDTQRGRLYLPLEDLNRFGYTEADVAAGRMSDPFVRLMEFESKRARDFFKKAGEDLQASGEQRVLLPARIMAGVYSRLLDRIERKRFDVFSERISVPPLEQLAIAGREMLS